MEGTNLSSVKPVPLHQTQQTGAAYSSGVRFTENQLEAALDSLFPTRQNQANFVRRKPALKQ